VIAPPKRGHVGWLQAKPSSNQSAEVARGPASRATSPPVVFLTEQTCGWSEGRKGEDMEAELAGFRPKASLENGLPKPIHMEVKKSLEYQLANTEDSERQGHRLLLSPEEIDSMNFKILAAMHDRQLPFSIPKEHTIELLFFRRIFTRLREQKAHANEIRSRDRRQIQEVPEDVDENIPIQAFQRAMGRLFYVLRDPQGFDAKIYDQNGNNIVGWGEFCFVWKDRKVIVRLSQAERIFLTFDDPQSSYLARIISVVILGTIVASSLGFILSTVPECQDRPEDGSAPKVKPIFSVIENVCLVVFVLEYLVRLCTCWAFRDEVFDKEKLLELATGYDLIELNSPVVRLLKFVLQPQNLIDLAAILPGVVFWLMWLVTGETNDGGGGFVVLRLVRLTRIFRVFRLGKFVEPVVVIGRTVKQSTKALYVLAFNLLLGVVIFGSLMYLMEQGDWDPVSHEYLRRVGTFWNGTHEEEIKGVSPFKSIPHAFWWAIVTSTTVGYGDQYPTTSNGYIVAVVCMVWSLVILALPVGVIGGTFLQVWEDFNKTKKTEAEMLRREMVYVSRAIQRIEPAKVSRLVLLEVWNDDGTCQLLPNSPEDFMGEVKVELELPRDVPIRGRELRLRLESNPHVVKREVAGSIAIRYDWDPVSRETCDSQEEEDAENDSVSTQKLLHGMLRLQVLGASGLINTDWGRNGGTSSPYVMVLCYPTSPAFEDQLQPTVWRTPTAPHTMDPRWGDCFHSFPYLWYLPEHTAEHRARMSDTIGDDTPASARKRSATPVMQSRAARSRTEVVDMLSQLTTGLPKLTASLVQIQEEVQHLSGRVDKLSASLRDKDRIGVEGSGRLVPENQPSIRAGGWYQSPVTSGSLREADHGVKATGLYQSPVTSGSLREAAHGVRATGSPRTPCTPLRVNSDTVGVLRTANNHDQSRSPRSASLALSLKDLGSLVVNGGSLIENTTTPLPNVVGYQPDG